MFDNGFHQILPLSQIKMPAWRALTIFLCIYPPATMASAIGFVGQSIVAGPPCTRGEGTLHLIGNCLTLPIADFLSWYRSQSCCSHIWSRGCVCVGGGRSDGGHGQCPGGRTGEMTTLYFPRAISEGSDGGSVLPGTRRASSSRERKDAGNHLSHRTPLHRPPPPPAPLPCLTGPSVTPR